jgi:hypothetical protein
VPHVAYEWVKRPRQNKNKAGGRAAKKTRSSP